MIDDVLSVCAAAGICGPSRTDEHETSIIAIVTRAAAWPSREDRRQQSPVRVGHGSFIVCPSIDMPLSLRPLTNDELDGFIGVPWSCDAGAGDADHRNRLNGELGCDLGI